MWFASRLELNPFQILQSMTGQEIGCSPSLIMTLVKTHDAIFILMQSLFGIPHDQLKVDNDFPVSKTIFLIHFFEKT